MRPSTFHSCLSLMVVVAGGVASAAQASPPESRIAETDADRGVIDLGGGCRLENNVFHRAAIAAGEQRIYRLDGKDAPAFGWEWSWTPSKRSVLSFPSVVCGAKPWAPAGASPASGFPFRQGTRRLALDWEATIDAQGTHALMLDVWIISGPPARPDAITHELQVHLVPMSDPPSGWLVDRHGAFLFDRTSWDLWRSPDGVAARRGAVPDMGGHTWPVLILVPRRPVLRGPLDVGELLRRLVDRDLLPRGAWIADVELGSAVVEGRGRVQVTRFALDPR